MLKAPINRYFFPEEKAFYVLYVFPLPYNVHNTLIMYFYCNVVMNERRLHTFEKTCFTALSVNSFQKMFSEARFQ